MKLRLSNGYSFAVEFSATNAGEFRANLRRAAMEYFAHEGTKSPAQLHIASDDGEWLSANYPKSNAPHHVKFGQADSASWMDAARANSSSTWFEYELDSMSRFVVAKSPVAADPSTRTLQRQRKAAGQASPVGAPAVLDDAKRVLVILDAPSRAIAHESGDGNVSVGIRLALQYWRDHAK